MTNSLLKDWISNIQSFFNSQTKLAKLSLTLLGGLNTLGYAPFGLWLVPIITLAILIVVLQKAESAKRAAKVGFYYGLGWFGFGISWVHVAIAEFGGMPLPVSIVLMLALCSYLALYPALAAYLSHRLQSKLNLSVFPVAWILTELMRGFMFTGFPWLSIGYSQTNSPLAGYAPIIGELGIQFIVLLLALSLAHLLLNPIKQRSLKLSLVLATLALGYGLKQLDWQFGPDKQINLSLVQGNIEQSIKWQPETEVPTMKKYAEMTLPYWEKSDLVIWPEAAIPRLEIMANEFLREMDRQAAETDTALVTGIVDFQPETNLAFNNLIVLGKKRAEDQFGHYKYLGNNRFHKHHLLPIGEFVPFESFLRTLGPLFNLPMSSFSRGAYQQDNLIAKGIRLLPAICFEIAFPAQLKANNYHNTDIILTVSNDAWFGASHGPWQHLQIAQMRAMELAKPVVRATNNGVTAIVGVDGTVQSILPQFEAQVLHQTLTFKQAQTPFQQFGGILLFGFVLLYLGALFAKRNR